jgi:hypothetical protein
MERFEYEITTHPAEVFKHLVYFCSSQGECNLQEIPAGQTQMMEHLLNARGSEGWELVQATFGKDGILVFWKRMINKENGNNTAIIIDKV